MKTVPVFLRKVKATCNPPPKAPPPYDQRVAGSKLTIGPALCLLSKTLYHLLSTD